MGYKYQVVPVDGGWAVRRTLPWCHSEWLHYNTESFIDKEDKVVWTRTWYDWVDLGRYSTRRIVAATKAEVEAIIIWTIWKEAFKMKTETRKKQAIKRRKAYWVPPFKNLEGQ